MRHSLKHLGWVLVCVLPAMHGVLSVSDMGGVVGLPVFSTQVLADFDGDARPDLALGRYEHRRYRIKVHLSQGTSETSLILSAPEVGMMLLPLDVNRDRHLDLVVASAYLVRPLVIWLNDGHGSFRRGKVRGWTFGLSRAAGYSTLPVFTLIASWSGETRWRVTPPLGISLVNASEFFTPLPVESEYPPGMLLFASSLSRSPPGLFG